MEEIPPDLFPIQPFNGEGPTELKNEGLLLQKMAITPIETSTALAYSRKKYLIYFFIAASCLGLPAAIFLASSAVAWGLPHWAAQAWIFVLLLIFCFFFFAMLAWIASRSRALRVVGLRPVARKLGESADASMLAERHGRSWEYGASASGNFWRCSLPIPALRIENRRGQFYADPGLPLALHRLLSQLPRDRIWRELRISGGPKGLETSRPPRLAKYFLQDLWLAERLMDAMGD